MSEPLLHFGYITIVRQSIGCSRCTKRMHAKAVNFSADSGLQAIFFDDVPIDGAGIEMPIEASRPIISNRPEQGSSRIAAMTGL